MRLPINGKNTLNRHRDLAIHTNIYLVAYCTRCSMQMRNMTKYLTPFVHNLSYDVPLILKESTHLNDDIKMLCKSSTIFLFENPGDIQFQDTQGILSDSLVRLAENQLKAGYYTLYVREMVSYLPPRVPEELSQ